MGLERVRSNMPSIFYVVKPSTRRSLRRERQCGQGRRALRPCLHRREVRPGTQYAASLAGSALGTGAPRVVSLARPAVQRGTQNAASLVGPLVVVVVTDDEEVDDDDVVVDVDVDVDVGAVPVAVASSSAFALVLVASVSVLRVIMLFVSLRCSCVPLCFLRSFSLHVFRSFGSACASLFLHFVASVFLCSPRCVLLTCVFCVRCSLFSVHCSSLCALFLFFLLPGVHSSVLSLVSCVILLLPSFFTVLAWLLCLLCCLLFVVSALVVRVFCVQETNFRFTVTNVSSEPDQRHSRQAGMSEKLGSLFCVVKNNGIISRPGSKIYYYRGQEPEKKKRSRRMGPPCVKVCNPFARILWGGRGDETACCPRLFDFSPAAPLVNSQRNFCPADA